MRAKHCLSFNNLGQMFGTSKMHLGTPGGLGCCPFYGDGSVVVNSIHCLLLLPLFVRALCLVLVLLFNALCPSFAIILMGKRKLVGLLRPPFRCIVTISVQLIFLTVSWVGLQFVILVFPDHIHLRFWDWEIEA